MSYTVQCPHCQIVNNIGAEQLGSTVTCLMCQLPFTVGGQGPAVQPPPVPQRTRPAAKQAPAVQPPPTQALPPRRLPPGTKLLLWCGGGVLLATLALVGAFAKKAPSGTDSAGLGPTQVGDFEVRIRRHTLGVVEYFDNIGQMKYTGSNLRVEFSVGNLTGTKKLEYSGVPDAKLTDELGNNYREVKASSYRFGERFMDKIYATTSVSPGSELSDIVVFEPPVPQAKRLHLEMPRRPFGGIGTVRFDFPTKDLKQR